MDLSAVTFLDCAGLGPLVAAHRTLQASGARLRLRAVPAPALRLIRLTGLLSELTVIDAPASPMNDPAGQRSRVGEWPVLAEAAEAIVAHLEAQTPLDLWILTRIDGADQVVLATSGTWAAGLPAGTVVPWLGSFSMHMAAGRAPGLAPRTENVALYAAAATGRWKHVRAFCGVPVLRGDGELVGTLCGFSARPDDPSVTQSTTTLQLARTTLSIIATTEHALEVALNTVDQARSLAETDVLTGLCNRRGWQAALLRETQRNGRYGGSAGIVSLDLDLLKTVNDLQGHAAGDRLLRATADILTEVCRPSDVIARSGGDEFVVLAINADDSGIHALTTRITETLHGVGIAASAAGATHTQGEELADTWSRADRDMYAIKRHRSVERTRPT